MPYIPILEINHINHACDLLVNHMCATCHPPFLNSNKLRGCLVVTAWLLPCFKANHGWKQKMLNFLLPGKKIYKKDYNGGNTVFGFSSQPLGDSGRR